MLPPVKAKLTLQLHEYIMIRIVAPSKAQGLRFDYDSKISKLLKVSIHTITSNWKAIFQN